MSLGWVEWDLTEATKRSAEESALAGAVANARGRAQRVAAAAGGGTVVPVEIADPGLLRGMGPGGGDGPVPLAMAAAARADQGGAGAALDPEHVQLKPEHVVTEAAVHARFTC